MKPLLQPTPSPDRPSRQLRRLGQAVLLLAGLLIPTSLLPAATFPARGAVTESSSRQFTVHGQRPNPGQLRTQDSIPENPTVTLDVDILATTCERVKKAFLEELQMPDAWQGRITLAIDASAPPDSGLLVTGSRFGDSWHYQVLVPEKVSSQTLVRGLIEVLLLEFCNRNAHQKGADLPYWLVTGMSQDILAANPARLVIQPQTRTITSFSRPDPLAEVRRTLETHRPLTFNEIALPAGDLLSGARKGVYAACAQLFYREWIRLTPNRAPVINFLWTLPDTLNWQTAFLAVYKPQFPRMLDVEKWWAVTLLNTTHRDPNRFWSWDDSLRRLDDLLTVQAQLSTQSRELPHKNRLTLQQVINTWTPAIQLVVMRQKLTQLVALRPQTTPELAPLVERYIQTIEQFIQRKQNPGLSATPRNPAVPSYVLITLDTTRQLDELDRQRQTAHAVGPNPTPGADTNTTNPPPTLIPQTQRTPMPTQKPKPTLPRPQTR